MTILKQIWCGLNTGHQFMTSRRIGYVTCQHCRHRQLGHSTRGWFGRVQN